MADSICATVLIATVLSEIQSGEGLSLSAAGRQFPAHRGKGTIAPSTIFRWVKSGAKAPDGRVVTLAAVRVGGRWITSHGAVLRFVAALTPAADPIPASSPPPTRTPTQRQRASEAAARELERRGA